MNPEEKELLEKSLRLARENNDLLKKIDARGRRAAIYGFIKLLLVLAPFVIGYFLLEPYIDQGVENYNSFREVINTLSR